MNVKLVKLTTGEEFVADVQEGENCTSCKNMSKLYVTRDGGGFVPFNPMLPDDALIVFDNKHIIFVSDVKSDFENAYKETYGKIVTPSNKLIIG